MLKEQKKQKDEVTQNNCMTFLRTISGKGFIKDKPIKDDKGEPLVTQEQLKRWEEYLSRILNKDKDKKTQSTEEEAEENENEDIRIKLHAQRLKSH
jgi:hypothetical protein